MSLKLRRECIMHARPTESSMIISEMKMIRHADRELRLGSRVQCKDRWCWEQPGRVDILYASAYSFLVSVFSTRMLWSIGCRQTGTAGVAALGKREA
jgi:hypothetical protein